MDVPCGSGRHALALAARGHRVTGLDISTEAIEHARAAAAERGLEVEFFVGEMRSIGRMAGFDAALCMGNSFGYLDLAGTREFVHALATAIRPGGGLVIDFAATAESVLPSFNDEPRTMVAGDITVTATNHYDIVHSRLVSTYEFARGSEKRTSSALHHMYTHAQIGAFLADAGCSHIASFADPDDTPFTLGAGRLLLTAVR